MTSSGWCGTEVIEGVLLQVFPENLRNYLLLPPQLFFVKTLFTNYYRSG